MFPPAPPDLGTIQAELIAAMRTVATNKNQDKMNGWKLAVTDYLTNAQHIMELNVGRAVPLLMPMKPDPNQYLLIVIADAPTTDQNHLPVSVTYVAPPPCPDPPPLATPPPNGSIDVGVYDFGPHGVGGFWTTGVGDNYAPDQTLPQTPVLATSKDGVTAKWTKYAVPWGGYYIRQS